MPYIKATLWTLDHRTIFDPGSFCQYQINEIRNPKPLYYHTLVSLEPTALAVRPTKAILKSSTSAIGPTVMILESTKLKMEVLEHTMEAMKSMTVVLE